MRGAAAASSTTSTAKVEKVLSAPSRPVATRAWPRPSRPATTASASVATRLTSRVATGNAPSGVETGMSVATPMRSAVPAAPPAATLARGRRPGAASPECTDVLPAFPRRLGEARQVVALLADAQHHRGLAGQVVRSDASDRILHQGVVEADPALRHQPTRLTVGARCARCDHHLQQPHALLQPAVLELHGGRRGEGLAQGAVVKVAEALIAKQHRGGLLRHLEPIVAVGDAGCRLGETALGHTPPGSRLVGGVWPSAVSPRRQPASSTATMGSRWRSRPPRCCLAMSASATLTTAPWARPSPRRPPWSSSTAGCSRAWGCWR